MNTVREHWDTVKEVRAELLAKFGEFDSEGRQSAVYLMSLRRRKQGVNEGRVSVATIHVAAMMLAQETHRLATPEEIAAWQDEQTAKGKAIQQERTRSESKVNINLGEAVSALFAQQLAAAAPAAPTPAPQSAPAPAPAKAKATASTFD